jgi:hypothetical protein
MLMGKKTHGESYTTLYKRWNGMRKRCNCITFENYKYYGGKGIKICDEWNDYLTFKEWAINNGYEEGLSLERIDVDKDYCPENCKWIPLNKQAINRSNRKEITINGITKSISEWSKESGVKRLTILGRLESGYTGEDLIRNESLTKRKIVCNETKKIYNSLIEAGKELNLDYKIIWQVLNNNRKDYNGFTFTYINQ